MLRLFGLLSLSAFVALASGCAMCCHPYDCNYLYQGGRWVRDIPTEGRVGSAFYNAGHRLDDDVAPAENSPPAGVNELPAPENGTLLEPMSDPTTGGMLEPSPSLAPDSRLVPSRTLPSSPGSSVPYLPRD
jgi:hypothetical protein